MHLQRVVPAAVGWNASVSMPRAWTGFDNLYGAIGWPRDLLRVRWALLEHMDARVTFIVAGIGGLLATVAAAVRVAC
ncbi:hypothetical protein GCM10009789_54840 [Kribbella sancticallisti]|uniref:Uncharacterized protein n=2 Tax=Kribbella sancticallisti TaxID=460087 RepID=A0ABP4Q0G8_9ACTN